MVELPVEIGVNATLAKASDTGIPEEHD